MEAHRRSSSGTRLIDGAILLLSLVLLAWVGLIFAASRSQEDGTGDRAAAEAPPPGGPGMPHSEGGKLVWHDEFNEARCPSRAKWSFEHGFV
ncbi:MAG TPA: hypothetical protein VIZ61_01055, partial [Solirubrobacterales bacterium]